jgi:hypothetical protein
MSIDAKKLEKAIYWVRNNAGLRDLNALSIEYLDIMADAAEAHLATLPKTRTVEGWRCNWTYKGEPGGYQTHLTRGDAVNEYVRLVARGGGYSDVFISWPHPFEVPA